jgi:hypothetical protein
MIDGCRLKRLSDPQHLTPENKRRGLDFSTRVPIPGAKGEMIPLAPVVFEGHVMADPVGGLLWGPSRGRGKAVSSATRMLALPFFREAAARADGVCSRAPGSGGGAGPAEPTGAAAETRADQADDSRWAPPGG